jgi:hypothetical protein
MPTIKITDQVGLDVDAQTAPWSALLKYVQQVPTLRLDNLDLAKIGGLTLDDPAIRSLTTGLSFQAPFDFEAAGAKLAAAAGSHGSVQIVTSASDLPREISTDVRPDSAYISIAVETTAAVNLSGGTGVLAFGASPSTKVELASYSRFPLKTGVRLTDAVKQTVAGFSVPIHCADLEDLPAGQITKVALSGTLTLSGNADLLATTNPLASANLPGPLPGVSVSAGGSVTVGVSCEIECDYQIVAGKLDNGNVRLGWYRASEREVTVRGAASEGLSASLGGTDLFSRVVAAISADAAVDLQELQRAGVPAEQAEDIQNAVKAAVSRKLEIAIGAAFSASDTPSATFLYEIAPAALNGESRTAIDRALLGNFSALHGSELPGISCLRSIWDDTCKQGLELDVNLLGILNYRSITSLALEGKVVYEPATGALVITDKATADRIRSASVNFGADTQKLRHVLAESFLITAAYHGSRRITGPVSLRCTHSFFELQQSTSPNDMARKLRTGLALALLALEETQLPGGITDFGRTLFSVSTDYSDDLVTRMFLDGSGSPLPHDLYETAGRNAIQFLVQPTDPDAVRRRPAIEDDLWRRMKAAGQPGIPSLFLGVPGPFVGAITADYSTIQWWADTMSDTAQKLAAIRGWLEQNPGASLEEPRFQKLRDDLAAHLREVAANTREEFGEPWGLIAMNQIAGSSAGARILITGPRLVCEKRRALAAMTEKA